MNTRSLCGVGAPRPQERLRRRAGFALVITVVLLALLVLVVYALSALNRVGSDASATAVYQAQARQNALLGLSRAVGELQRFAAEDHVMTGMAGIVGIAPGAGQSVRHWAVVWDASGSLVRRLVSGSGADLSAGSEADMTVTMAGAGSLGVDEVDREHVWVELEVIEIAGSAGRWRRLGRVGWWTADEGAKLSVVVPANEAPVAGGAHAFDSLVGLAGAPGVGLTGKLMSYEQIELLGVTPGNRRRNLHVLGLTHRGWLGATRVAGRLNINSASQRYWTGVAGTYNGLRPADAPAIGDVAAFGRAIAENFAAADEEVGKLAGGPFPSTESFLNSALLSGALGGADDLVDSFGAVMRPWLNVRSDTFRVRAYGDALNPSDATRAEATAWCEAIVQREKDDPSASIGRFVVTYFRWLGSEDL